MAIRDIEEIQFVDLDTGAPIVTVKGDNAQVLLEESEFVKTFLELGDQSQANPRVLVVPIGDFPTDRREIFSKVLKGVPVGKYQRWRYEYYPLGAKEEKDIQKAVNAKIAAGNTRNRNDIVNDERLSVIQEVLRYLMIPDALINQMLVFDDLYIPEKISVDDVIDGLVERHASYLYLTGQYDKLTPKEKQEQKEYFDQIENKYKENMRKLGEAEMKNRRLTRRYNRSYYNSNNNNYAEYNDAAREIQNTYDFETNKMQYIPEEPKETGGMTTTEYEKFLRTQYYKPKKPLNISTNYRLNLLFNGNSKRNRTRANERNNSAVVFYNPNKPAAKTRKRNNKNKNKAGKNAWNNE